MVAPRGAFADLRRLIIYDRGILKRPMAKNPELSSKEWSQVQKEALGWFQKLLRTDTTNPPGNELALAELMADILRSEGIEAKIYEPAKGRANLVARLSSSGSEGPLLLAGHMDVVPADPEHWTHPPFAGKVSGGYIWGRGAIDMKNSLVYNLTALSLLKRLDLKLKRDVILLAVSDEERGCQYGSKWMVENHPEAIRAEYALNELGGFTLHAGGKRFYPIQVAEKGVCWFKIIREGQPGHGSLPHGENALVELCRALVKLHRRLLPLHVTEEARLFLRKMGSALPPAQKSALTLLLDPKFHSLAKLLPNKDQARFFIATLHNTACPTGLNAGKAPNVIPGRAEAVIDGRFLPGQTVDDLLREVRRVIGPGFQYEVLRHAPPTRTPYPTPLYELISDCLLAHDPGSSPTPYLITGFTDAKYYAELGIKTYGFSPVKFPPGVVFSSLYHGHDERIPVEGFYWGLRVFYDVVSRFCAA